MAFFDNWDQLNNQPPMAQQTHSSDHPLPTHNDPTTSTTTTANHINSTPPELSSANSHQDQHDAQHIAQLENTIATLQNERQQILNELNSLRENQYDTVERTRRELSASYDLKLANLQQALVEKEHQMQSMEQQLIDTKHSLGEEIAKRQHELSEREQKYASALSEQEKMHAELLSERERRHAEELARVSSSVTREGGEAVQSNALATQLDSDELEAERLKLIKSKLKEIHEAEISQLKAAHEAEKQQIRDDFQMKMDGYCKQAVDDANTKIKEMYEQFVTAHKAMEQQKSVLESTVSELQSEINTVSARAEKSQQEKASIEEEYQRLRDSHSAEIELERRNSVTLEKKLDDWKEKASRLETDLIKTSVHETEVQSERDEAITRMSEEYEQRIRSLQHEVEESQTRLKEAESQYQFELTESETRLQQECLSKLQEADDLNQRKLEEMVEKYEQQLSEAKSDHASQVDMLEASMSEFTCSKGSLEVAEERMKSLQGQLNLYRNQEKGYEARIAELNQQHAEDLAVSRTQLESEYTGRVAGLEGEVSGLTEELAKLRLLNETLAGQSSSEADALELTQRLKQTQALLQEATTQRDADLSKHEQVITELKMELAKVSAEAGSLGEQNTERATELTATQQHLQEAEQKRAELQQQVTQISNQMERERSTHEAQVSKLRTQLQKEAETKQQERVQSLQTELSDLTFEKSTWESGRKDLMSQLELAHRKQQEFEHTIKRLEAERNHLSEECDRFQKAAKNFEVDMSISKSSEEQNRIALERSSTALQETLAALGTKEAELDEMRCEIERLQEEGQGHETEYQQLLDQMGAKNKEFADLKAENDSLSSSLPALKRKLEESAETCEKLKSQLESSWGVNEELEALKQQTAELSTYKDNYGDMQQRVELLEAMVRSKDENLVALQEQFKRADIARISVEESLGGAYQEVTSLKQEISRLSQVESAVKAQLSPLEKDQLDGSELNAFVEAMQAKIEQAESRCEMGVAEIDEWKRKFGEVNAQLSLAANRNDELAKKIANSEQQIETLNTELSLSQRRSNNYAEKLAKRDQEVEELNTRLSATLVAKDTGVSELEKMNRIITDLRARIASVDDQLAQKSQVVLDQNQTVEDLEAKLSHAEADLTELQAEKSQLQLDLLQSQANPDSSASSSELEDLAQKYGDLQQAFEELTQRHSSVQQAFTELTQKYGNLQQAFEDVKREKAELLSEVNDLRVSSTTNSPSKSLEALEAKVREQEETIQDLNEKLARNSSNSNSFTTRPFQSDFSRFARSPLEATLTRARQTLIEKLQEKAAIEKELGMRRATLESQKAEKQHLEDLLYEKKRFEQELQNQKTLLQSELTDLESRLTGGGGKGHGGGKRVAMSVSETKVD